MTMTSALLTLEKANRKIEDRFESKLEVNFDLSRKLVSFQANKKEPGYRWFKFKEGYSSGLVNYVMLKLHIDKSETLDPFAGSGTTLFGASLRGLDSVGIELLPIATEIIEVRKLIASMDKIQLREILKKWSDEKPWELETSPIKFPHLNITRGAFPDETEKMIGLYLNAIKRKKNKELRRVLQFPLLCILEEISFTRKDGQYLRWDFRSGRVGGKKKFNKGVIKTFDAAITQKLQEIYQDIEPQNLFNGKIVSHRGNVKVLGGSCLSILPKMRTSQFSFIMTSPPYCNRYDYTRTYALELALLGVNNESIKELRQTMITCTVENREKPELKSLFNAREYYYAGEAFDSQKELRTIFLILFFLFFQFHGFFLSHLRRRELLL